MGRHEDFDTEAVPGIVSLEDDALTDIFGGGICDTLGLPCIPMQD